MEDAIKNKRDRKHCKYCRKFKTSLTKKSTQDYLNPLIFDQEHSAGLVPLTVEKKVSHLERGTQWVRKHPAASSCLFSNPCGMLFREHPLTTDFLGL